MRSGTSCARPLMRLADPPAARLRALLRRFAGRRVLVTGDIILDEYLFGNVKRISPEAPIPVFEFAEESVTPGAAAYVAGHVRHLGGEAILCGVVGDDVNGRRLQDLLEKQGIATDGLIMDPDRPTTVKTRVIARHQQMLRIDRERLNPVSPDICRRMLSCIQDTIRTVDAVIFSDYDKGAFTVPLIEETIRAARLAGIPVAVNPKPRLALKFKGATIVSMNQEEAAACLKRPLPDDAAFARGGTEIRRRLSARAVLITRHEHGMALFTGDGACSIPTRAKEVFDGTGAGDTVIAVAGMGLASGGRLAECVHLANVAAGVEVGKLGCALVSREEIARNI